MPRSRKGPTQPPSEPSRGQLAPPGASTVTEGATATTPSGVSKRSAPSASHPVQRWRSAKRTPSRPSRASQARSSGDAFMAVGNTRPEEPTKHGWPRPSAHALSASGGNAAMAGRSQWAASP